MMFDLRKVFAVPKDFLKSENYSRLIEFRNKISEHFLMNWSSVQARRQKRLAEDERFLEFQRKTESL